MSFGEVKKILYVEDDRGYARLFKKRMERNGYFVDLAYDGEEGLNKWDPAQYDVLVLDYKLPIYNGTEFIKQLSLKGPLPPIIMVTGMADASVAVEAMKLGASDYIMKDANVNYLELMPSVLEQVFHHHQLKEGKKKAEEALRESEGRFRSLFEHSNDAIIIHNLKGIILDVNQRAAEMLQQSSEILRGENLKTFLPQKTDEEERPMLYDAIIKGNSLYESRFKLADGTIVDVEISSRITGKDNDIIQSIVRDITVRKWMEKELVNKNRELNDFAHRICHDLKNPLTLMNGFATAIKDSPELFETHFQKIIDMSGRLIRFIDDLLKLTRAGIVISDMQEIDIETMLRSLFRFSLPREIPRELEIQSPIPPIIADPRGIEEILKNLILNSLQNRDPEKEKLIMKVTWEKKGKFVIITLSDNGMGIAPTVIEKIFDPGFTTEKSKGTGYGLAIVKKIVDAHGGDIWVESKGEKKGAEFYLKMQAKMD